MKIFSDGRFSKWAIFAVMIPLLPLFANLAGSWFAESRPPDLVEILGDGDLMILATVIAAAGIGDVLYERRITKHGLTTPQRWAVSLCLLIVIGSVLLYAIAQQAFRAIVRSGVVSDLEIVRGRFATASLICFLVALAAGLNYLFVLGPREDGAGDQPTRPGDDDTRAQPTYPEPPRLESAFLKNDRDASISALYRLPPNQFVTARDRLASQLWDKGERRMALDVAGMRQPSVSVWAANQLHEAAPEILRELLDAGDAMVRAHGRVLKGRRGATRAFQRAIARCDAAIALLVRQAGAFLDQAGPAASQGILDQLATTLKAAIGNPRIWNRLALGRLTDNDFLPENFLVPDSPAQPDAPVSPVDLRHVLSDTSIPTNDERWAAAPDGLLKIVERTRQAAEGALTVLEDAELAAASQQRSALAADMRAKELAEGAAELRKQADLAAAAASQAKHAADAAAQNTEVLVEKVGVAQESAAAARAAYVSALSVLD